MELDRSKHPVSFVAGSNDLLELKKAIFLKFADKRIVSLSSVLVQIKSEEWQGEWIDVLEDEEIPNRSVLKVLVCDESEVHVSGTLFVCCTCSFELGSKDPNLHVL